MKTNTPTPSSRATLLAPAFAVCGALAMFAGCASETSHVVSAPPPAPASATQVTTTQTTQSVPVAVQQPTYVTTTPAGTTSYTTTTTNPMPATTYVVTSAPPALQTETVLARPSADYVWVPGYWTWRESRYQWVAGHWEMPPYKGSDWVAPRTEMENGSYRFYEGHWN